VGEKTITGGRAGERWQRVETYVTHFLKRGNTRKKKKREKPGSMKKKMRATRDTLRRECRVVDNFSRRKRENKTRETRGEVKV